MLAAAYDGALNGEPANGSPPVEAHVDLHARGRELFRGRHYNQRLLFDGTKPNGGTSLATSFPPGGVVDWECSEDHILDMAVLAYASANKDRRRRVNFWLKQGRLLQAVRFVLNTDAVLCQLGQIRALTSA